MRSVRYLLILSAMLVSACASDGDSNMTDTKEILGSDGLIPRQILFGNPDHASVRLSPDGTKIAYLAPVNSVLNVWVGPVDDPEAAEPVTDDTYRGIRAYSWTYTNRHIIYIQDKDGDENWRIYCVDLTSGLIRDMTPFDGVQARIQAVSRKFPDEIIIALNNRDPQYHDLYRLNLTTGKMTLLENNTGFAGFDVDDEYRVRLAVKVNPDGGSDIFKPLEGGDWQSFMKIGLEDSAATGTYGFNKTNRVVYLADSRGRDTAALYAMDMETGEKTLIAEDPKADFGGFMSHPTEKNVQAVAFNYERVRWQVIDPSIEEDLEYLRALADGDVQVVSRTLDDSRWIVAYVVDNGPARYYRYNRENKTAQYLFTDRKDLEGLTLSRMVSVVVGSRDDMSLVSFYTIPNGSDSNGDGIPDRPLPMVLYVHGGPWARDIWGYSSIHQWLANRGYAVLSVNYRGSTGFGKNFTNAGNLEWGRKMHDDLIDAVNWTVAKGIADPNRVAIMGGSYGGYASLAGLTFTPEFFACAVDIVGPSNLITLIETIPPYWVPEIEQLTKRVGDHRTPEGRDLLRERSPLAYVDRIKRPLLIGQGANDPRVKQNESDQIVRAMQEKGIPVTYILYPDEGHGFARPENRMSFYAVAEAFLSSFLGGRFEPIGGDFENSTITVPAGSDGIPGLEDALSARNETG